MLNMNGETVALLSRNESATLRYSMILLICYNKAGVLLLEDNTDTMLLL